MENKKPSFITYMASFMVVVVVVFFILGVFGSEDDYQGKETSSYTYSTEDFTTDDNQQNSTSFYTATDESEKEHVFLAAKDMGDCKTLTGDVVLTVVLVDDADSTWSQQAISEFKKGEEEATEKLRSQAETNGVELNIEVKYVKSTAQTELTMSNFNVWVSEAVSAMGFSDESQVIPALKEKYSVKEAPVVFVTNREGRCFSNVVSTDKSGFEYAILYSTADGDYLHELYHLFGAQDFYYPKEVYAIAKEYFPKSSMGSTEDGDLVDNFSAYLIGWDDEMDYYAESFFEEISWVTEDDVLEGRKEATQTGYNTVRMENGVYTGYLVDGMCHGEGTLVWDNGDVYEGNWEYGNQNGYGIMRFADGGTLEGNWCDGAINGYVVIRYPDGAFYEGNMVGEHFEGYGVMTYAEGTVYDGYWSESAYDGYGTVTYSDGTVLQGYWEMGEFVG